MLEILRKFKRFLSPSVPVLYKIGNIKKHNSHVDTLIPGFVEIGDNFVSAPGSIILAHDASLFVSFGYYRVQHTKIGDNVFLGANATILPGVTIGDGCIIGAGSVVTKDLPANVVAAGNPARVLCTAQEYFEKCLSKGILVKAPESFQKVRAGTSISSHDIQEFRKKCLDIQKNE